MSTEYGGAVRVVSLVPEATELLCRMGGEALLVGRSEGCDWPVSVARVPIVRPGDDEVLRSLAPDVILAGELPVTASAEIVRVAPASFADVLDDCLRVGRAVGLASAGERTMVELRESWWTAVDHVAPFAREPEVLFLAGVDPLTVGGAWIPHLIQTAGGRHSLNAQGASRRLVTAEEILEAAPERVVVCLRGKDLAAHHAEMAALTRHSWWPLLPAVLDGPGRVALVDGRAMFHRAGPRLVDAFRFLVGWINGVPELIPPDFPWESR